MTKLDYINQIKKRDSVPNKRIYPDRYVKDTYISVSNNRIDFVVKGTNLTISENSVFVNTSKVFLTPSFGNVVFGMLNTINPANIVPLPSSIVTPIPTSLFVNPIKFLGS